MVSQAYDREEGEQGAVKRPRHWPSVCSVWVPQPGMGTDVLQWVQQRLELDGAGARDAHREAERAGSCSWEGSDGRGQTLRLHEDSNQGAWSNQTSLEERLDQRPPKAHSNLSYLVICVWPECELWLCGFSPSIHHPYSQEFRRTKSIAKMLANGFTGNVYILFMWRVWCIGLIKLETAQWPHL